MNPQTKVIELVRWRAGDTGRIDELTARRVGTVNRGTVVLRDPLGRDVLKMAAAPFYLIGQGPDGQAVKVSWHQTFNAARRRARGTSYGTGSRYRGLAVICPPPLAPDSRDRDSVLVNPSIS